MGNAPTVKMNQLSNCKHSTISYCFLVVPTPQFGGGCGSSWTATLHWGYRETYMLKVHLETWNVNAHGTMVSRRRGKEIGIFLDDAVVGGAKERCPKRTTNRLRTPLKGWIPKWSIGLETDERYGSSGLGSRIGGGGIRSWDNAYIYRRGRVNQPREKKSNDAGGDHLGSLADL